jgi:hypothetical protein
MSNPVCLRSASKYAVLAASTVTSTGFTTVWGLLDVSPGTAIVGFGPGLVNTLGMSATASIAQGYAKLAYDDAAGRVVTELRSGDLAGLTLFPGVYKSTDGMELTTGDLTLDAQGNSDALFIFQMASTLGTAAGKRVFLTGRAQAANVVWQVGSSCTLGIGSHLVGTIIAYSSITLTTGASVEGRLIALNGAVTLDSNVVEVPSVTPSEIQSR